MKADKNVNCRRSVVYIQNLLHSSFNFSVLENFHSVMLERKKLEVTSLKLMLTAVFVRLR